jgi:chromosome partitioning protein
MLDIILGRGTMKIIVVGTQKGGVGKSLTAFNLAGLIAESGKKVLAIDIDPQGNLTNNFGVDRTADGFLSIREVLEKKAAFEEVVIKKPIPELPTCDLIGSSIFLIKTEFRINSKSGREYILKNYIEDNKDKFEQYDYVIIDTNPSMSAVNQNAFVAADSIIIVSDVSMNAYEGAELFMALWEEICDDLRIENKIKAFLINNFDRRINIAREYLDFLETSDDIGPLLLDTLIPANVKLKESELEAKPINLYDRSSKGYEAFNSLVNELYERGIL